jgi:hypothetical protein
MRSALRSLVPLALALLLAIGCAASAARAETSPQFWVHMAPQKQAALFVGQTTGAWFSEWVSDGTGAAMWRNPTSGVATGVEHWTLRDGWLVLTGYSNDFGAVQWPADCVRAEIEDVQTGATAPLTCRGGQQYVPFLIPRDPWRIRIWGVIANSSRFYWEAEFTPGQSVTDSCYYSGPITRDAIVQREVWWDSTGGGPKHDGWAEGTGTAPFDASGKPVVPTVTYGVETTVAKGEGVLTHKDLATGLAMCLYSRWDWQ